MNPESNSVMESLADKNISKESSNSSEIQELDDDEPYSFIRTSSALISLVIAISSLAFPIFAVLIESPLQKEETTYLFLEPHGSKHSRPLSLSRFSQHSC